MNKIPLRFFYTSVFLFAGLVSFGQEVHSLGIFTGITAPYTWDEGINKDSRYREKYSVKFAPVGIHYGIDFEGYGVSFDPNIFRVGQSYNIINIQGGQIGERKIDLNYFQLPVGLKLHMIDLSFFKVSFITSLSVSVLIDGNETVSHSDDKINFPMEVYPNLPPNYIVDYDGVISPEVNDLEVASKSDFKPIQLFAAIGFRSDWDLAENWRVSFDLRANYGIMEPRTSSYRDKASAHENIYVQDGARRDLFLGFNIGIARTVEIDAKQKERKVKIRNERKPHRPSKYPWPSPRNKKPKKN